MSSYPVVVYTDTNYSGTSAQIGYDNAFSTMQALGLPNDSISSIRVAAFTQVTLYADNNYSGSTLFISGPADIPDFQNYSGGFNDRASSIIVAKVNPSNEIKVSCCTGTRSAYTCGDYAPGSPTCEAAMRSYCTADNISDSRCKTWCRTNDCDDAVNQYCAANPSDPYCACIKSKATNYANPKCVDKACLDSGYLTTSMRSTACPTVITCEVKNQLTNSGVILSNTVPIQQNCGGVTSTGPAPQAEGDSYDLYMYLLIIFVAIIFFVLLIAVALTPEVPGDI
jgi:hypothetical protein